MRLFTTAEWFVFIMLAALALLLSTALVCAQDVSLSLSLAPAATNVPSTDTDAGTELFKEETIQCEECSMQGAR
jgi:hypothetical protein